MMDILQQAVLIDKSLFSLINSGMSNALFDAALPFFREKWFWAPLYLFVVAHAFLHPKLKGWLVVVGLIAAVGAADLVSSRAIKKNVQRLRPCNDPEMVDQVVKRVGCGGGYSFTSSHAANHFAAAIFLISVFGLTRWKKYGLLLWAGLICFSQVYVGVHYPADVFFGALLGLGIGHLTYLFIGRFLHTN
jgi:undecaprenyl-diphosphatase